MQRKSELASLLGAAEQRAEDVRRTLLDPARLASADDAVVLSRFETLSQQLGLLVERGTTPASEALLDRHYVVPSGFEAAESGASAAHVPTLLSTMLDKEQEDVPALLERFASGALTTAAQMTSDRTLEERNKAIDAACDHLAQLAARRTAAAASSIVGQKRSASGALASERQLHAAASGEALKQKTALAALLSGSGL